MKNLFQNKYRIKSTRLEHWDYSSNGAYYITICTKDRECYLGNVVNRKIELSGIGEIVKKYWCVIPIYFQHVSLDEFVIMPNHLHGIVVINNENNCRDAINRVSTGIDNQKRFGGITKNCNPMLSKSLSTIIRWYKGRSTYEINKMQNQIHFHWQPRFYESIIRNEKQLNAIREYIINNPLNWGIDRNNS